MTANLSAGYFGKRRANDSTFITVIIRIKSSSTSASLTVNVCAPRVFARLLIDAESRRESNKRFGVGQKILFILNTDTKPRHTPSEFKIGSTRIPRSSINPRASTTVACDETLTKSVCITSRILGDTSATKRGGGIPKV